jgi:hypothetical protein
MADDVPLPIAAPTIVATRDLGGGRQAQIMQAFTEYATSANVVSDASQIAYTSGQLFGSVLTMGTFQRGLWMLDAAIVADLSGAALPALDLILYSDSDTPPLTGTADGDTFTLAGFTPTAGGAVKIAAASLAAGAGAHPFFPNAGVAYPSPSIPLALTNFDHFDATDVDLKAVLVTTATVASPTGGPFAILVVARRVATDAGAH